MKTCTHGLGYEYKICGAPATTTRNGWPLCDEHATLWDSWEERAERDAERRD